MRKVTSDRPRRLAWDLVERPKDSDFAVDIGLLSHSRRDIQEKADLVDRTARTVGLKSTPFGIEVDLPEYVSRAGNTPLSEWIPLTADELVEDG